MKKKLLGKKRKRISESLLVYGIREEKEFIYYSKIVELPLKTMKKYEIKEYDYVIIKYDNRKIIAMVLEDFSDEHDEDYIRLNSIMRKNLLVDIGYKIRLKKCSNIDEIDEIVLKPLRNKKRTYKYYVINYFQYYKKAVCKGNIFYIKYKDKPIPFKILKLNPSNYGFICHKTKFKIIKKKNKEIVKEQVNNLQEYPKENIYVPIFMILFQFLIFHLYKRNLFNFSFSNIDI